MILSFRKTPWLLVLAVLGVSSCQGRQRQTMVVEDSDTNSQQQGPQQPPPGAGGPATDSGAQLPAGGDIVAAAKLNKLGQVLVNNWPGEKDVPSDDGKWSVDPGSPSSGVAANPADPQPPASNPVVPAGQPASS